MTEQQHQNHDIDSHRRSEKRQYALYQMHEDKYSSYSQGIHNFDNNGTFLKSNKRELGMAIRIAIP